MIDEDHHFKASNKTEKEKNNMYLTAWIIKFIAIQLMLKGVIFEAKDDGNIYRALVIIGAILFAIASNLLYVQERNRKPK